MIHNFYFFQIFWVFEDCTSKYGYSFMTIKMSYYVIIYDHNVTSKILSRESNYIVGVVMLPKFGNSSISMRKVIITSIL